MTEHFVNNPDSFNASLDNRVMDCSEIGGSWYPDNLSIVQAQLGNNDLWERLENIDCVHEYAQNFLRERSDVIVVVDTPSTNPYAPAIIGAASGGWGMWPYAWICLGCTATTFGCASQLLNGQKAWAISHEYIDYPVLYCLSKKVHNSCTLQYGYIITLTVVCGNVIKLLCFFFTYRLLSRAEASGGKGGRVEELIFTTDDAIASFLRTEDLTTGGICLAEKTDFENGIWSIRWVDIKPMRWTRRGTKAWFRAIGLRRWSAFILL